jgi:hypothetical protein
MAGLGDLYRFLRTALMGIQAYCVVASKVCLMTSVGKYPKKGAQNLKISSSARGFGGNRSRRSRGRRHGQGMDKVCGGVVCGVV